MLIDFKVKNFLSYKDLQTFSMVTGATKRMDERVEKFDDVSLLKFGAIYGSNAAGKSNLVKAIAVMQKLVLFGTKRLKNPFYYVFDNESKNEPTYFEVTLKLEDKTYAYGFEVSSLEHSFLSEWLCEESNENTKYLFDRNIVENSIRGDNSNKEAYEILDIYNTTTESNELLLKKIALTTKFRDNVLVKEIFNIFSWFLYKLKVTRPDSILTGIENFIDGDKLHSITSLLKSFDTGIEDIKPIEQNPDLALNDLPEYIRMDVKKSWLEAKNKGNFSLMLRDKNDMWRISVKNIIDDKNVEFKYERLCFYHKGNVPLTLRNESDGTIRLLDLAEILVSNSDDVTYVVDELDRCLHPQVTYKFVEKFLASAEKKKIQLIVTTHESRLLDFNILRRDEIWFTNKLNNESSLYSLEEFNVRFDKKIDKAYLEGRYGGVPIFDTVFPVSHNKCQE